MDTSELESLTKHEQILKYIESLPPGSRISVRQLAKTMDVSEGTAYRAIKDAESYGLVSTKERIGTVRVERKLRQHAEKLYFSEVVEIVEGNVLGGANGLHKELHKFVIGAMKQDAMARYVEAGSLLIVGNRDEVHQFALDQGAGVLITGGFDASAQVKKLADDLQLPIISSKYDTFTVASMINRAIFDRVIKKNILFVEDIVIPAEHVHVLKSNQTLKDWKKLIEQTGYSSFPVVDEWNKTLGIVTPQQMVHESDEQILANLMIRYPHTVSVNTSVASAAHLMAWEGIELLPVTDHSRKLLGVIYRQDVQKAMQYIQKQTEYGETFESLIWSQIEEVHREDGSLVFAGFITPQMTNHLGIVSEGILTILMTQATHRIAKEYKYGDLVIDHISSYFSKPAQIDTYLEIHTKVMEMSRKYGKFEIEIRHDQTIVAKSFVMAHVMDRL